MARIAWPGLAASLRPMGGWTKAFAQNPGAAEGASVDFASGTDTVRTPPFTANLSRLSKNAV